MTITYYDISDKLGEGFTFGENHFSGVGSYKDASTPSYGFGEGKDPYIGHSDYRTAPGEGDGQGNGYTYYL